MPQEWREAESHSTQSVVPMLAYADGPAAMDWLIRVFGFRERTRLLDPGGRLAHGELSAGDGLVMLATPSPDYEGPRQQAAIFLLPHLAILSFAPELWGILPIVFV